MRAAVLGSPVAHSLSPAMHRAAYAELGVDWSYDRIQCGEAELAGFVAGLDDSWAGLSLTMPLKRAALSLADSATGVARAVGAANTLVCEDGQWRADNTDVVGLRDALAAAGLSRIERPVAVGGGATACSTAAALAGFGVRRLTAVVRDATRAAGLVRVAGRFGVRCTLAPWPGERELAGADLVVSTVPAGAADSLKAYADRIPALFDVVYAPWPTVLATAVAGAGGTVVGGFELLLHQAGHQVTAMTGRPAPLEAMRAAGEAELARRGSRQSVSG